MADHPRSKGLSSAVCYKDSKAAFRWLEEAFGFEPLFVLLDEGGNLAHSEMEFGKSVIMGALSLYLDFVNMFTFLLQLMGDRR